MPELRVEPRQPGSPPPDQGRIVVPLWPFLVLALVLFVVLIAFWPQRPVPQVADFNPTTQQTLVLHYQGRRWSPAPNAPHAQTVIAPDRMRVVGHDQGHSIYALISSGGGAGAASPPLYLRSGNDRFVPLRPISP